MAITPVGYTGSGWSYGGKTYKPKPQPNPAAAAIAAGAGNVGAALPNVPVSRPIVPTVSIPQAATVAPAAAAVRGPSLGDYMSQIEGDPNFEIGRRNYENALEMGQRSLLADPINKLVSTYGIDPTAYLAAHPGSIPQNMLDLANRYIDPAALAAAKADPFSTSNQIQRTFGQALAGTPGQLAARGRLGSGASAIMASKLDLARGQQERQALDQFLSGVGSANQNWLNFQTEQSNTWRQAQEEIANRLAQMQATSADEETPIEAAPVAAAPAAQPDYSGGPNAVFQPAPATQRLIKKMRARGEFSSWERAMARLGSAS